MPFDINRYANAGKKRNCFHFLKYKLLKYKRYCKQQWAIYERNVSKPEERVERTIKQEFITLFIGFCKSFKYLLGAVIIIYLITVNIKIISIFWWNLLIWLTWIFSVIILLMFFSYIYKQEIDIDLQLKTENKINLKRGFNRLNAIFCVVCTIIFFFCYGTDFLNNYKNFEKNNTKFLDVKTKQEIITSNICSNFPEKFKKTNSLLYGYYEISYINQNCCICTKYDDDYFVLENNKDIIIKFPEKNKKFSFLFIEVFKFVFFNILIYVGLRILYILIANIINWLLKGFKSE